MNSNNKTNKKIANSNANKNKIKKITQPENALANDENIVNDSKLNFIEDGNQIESELGKNEQLQQFELSVEDQIDQLKKENLKIKNLLLETKNKINEKEQSIDVLEKQLSFFSAASESLTNWKENFTHSFAFQLRQKMREATEKLEADEKSIKKWLSEDFDIDLTFVKRIRNWFVKKFLLSLSLAGIITLTFILLDYYNIQSIDNALNNVGMSIGQVYFLIWIIFYFYFMSLLLRYSRQWSKHRRKLALASSTAASVMESLDYVRESRLRIDSLYPQIEQYLKILSLVIHHPWKVPQDLLNFKSEPIKTESLPESVDVAVPYLENKGNIFNTLVNKTVSMLFIKGWRASAFDQVVSKVGESLGISFSIGELDRDSRKNGLRNTYLKTHNESLEQKNEILENVARDRIKKVVPLVQEQVLNEIKLNVISAKNDPLKNLEISDDLVEIPENHIEWDSFLTQIGGYASPWSSLVFSNEGILRGRQELINRSFILANSRLSSLNSEPNTLIPTEGKTTRPVDLVLRVDLSSWCSAGEVKVFEGMPISEIENNLELEIEDKNKFLGGAI